MYFSEKYKNKIFSSISQLSSNYNYFLVDNPDQKISLIGKLTENTNFIIPTYFSKEELQENLLVKVKTYYDLNLTPSNYLKKVNFFNSLEVFSFTTGYGVIIIGSNLLVLDIDTIDQYNELLELSPNIVKNCKFKRINTDNPHKMHLYFKKPVGFETSGTIRRIKLNKEKLWICGLNKKKFPLEVDTAHLFRNERHDYDLVGHMDDITECPSEIIDRIIECQNNVYQP